MQYGLPNVTSTIGAEGMNGSLPWNGFVCDDENEFVEKSVSLYQKDSDWLPLQKKGFEIIEKRFKKEDFLPQFSERLDEISNNLEKHRNDNFLGQILQHHSLHSTKYLGKWIEEKNKNA